MKTIVWDVDDVLNDLMRCWFEHDQELGKLDKKLRYEDISENPPHRVLNISEKEYFESLDEFRLTQEAEAMQPLPEMVEWFEKEGNRFRHLALTARPLTSISAASSWVFRHFGRWIRGFHFVPSARGEQQIPLYDGDKIDFLKWLNKADIVIDDSESNIRSAEKLGFDGILIPRPWNRGLGTIQEALECIPN